MSVRNRVAERFTKALETCEAQGVWSTDARPQVLFERPRQDSHGDLATNVAMTLAKAARKSPRQVAEEIVKALDVKAGDEVFAGVEIAGPGFINLRLHPALYWKDLEEAIAQGAEWGRSKVLAGQKVINEYVSANPTGPMHVGHGRGAVIGDVISRLLSAAGADVHREYYVNDAGGQVGHLAHAVWVRAKELVAAEQPGAGVEVEALGVDDYKGEYVVDIAREMLSKLSAEEALELAKTPFEESKDRLQRACVELVLETMIKPDLALFNIGFDRFYSERAMHEDGSVAQAMEELEKRGVAAVEVLPPPKGQERDPDAPEQNEPLLVMKTKQFGDDADRALRKPDGSYTYFAGDVAYHWDKLQRGFSRIVNVWGADHGGYVARVRAAIEALGFDPKAFEVVLVQMVNLVRDGQPVRMGKRSGNFVTLREVIEEAGPDAMRVFFIMRSANSQFDFDLALARKQSDDNPVFYVQYGHARACSILKRAAERGVALPPVTAENLSGLRLPEELDLAKRILSLPDVVAGAAQALEPHRVVFYLQETIAAFHSYLSRYRHTEKVLSDDETTTKARLALVQALRLTLANTLDLIGVSAPERLDRAFDEEAEPAGS